MDKARETLTKASHKLAEQMYKAAQPTRRRRGGGPSAGSRRLARSRARTARVRRKTKA